MFVIAVISAALLEELATSFRITLWVRIVYMCVTAEDVFPALIDVSLAEQVLWRGFKKKKEKKA